MEVPGFSLVSLQGYAGCGETWAAVDAATGAECLLVVVPSGDAAVPAPLLRWRHEHADPVVGVVPLAGGGVALRFASTADRTLTAVALTGRSLSAGEVVTLGMPLGWVLAAAHGAGLAHGDLDARDVLLDGRGRPRLRGVGVAALAGIPVAPADDVAVLARLLMRLLGESSGPRADAVRAVLVPALAGHPAARPAAGDLAAGLGHACPPEPLRLPVPGGPTPADPPAEGLGQAADAVEGVRRVVPTAHGGAGRVVPPPGRRDRPRWPAVGGAHRRGSGPAAAWPAWLSPFRERVRDWWPPPPSTLVAGGGAVVLLALAVLVPAAHGTAPAAGGVPTGPVSTAGPVPRASSGVATAAPVAPGDGPPAAAAAHPPVKTDWGRVVAGLAAARSRAFATADPRAVVEADAPGSTAAAVDADRIGRYAAVGARTRGLAAEVTGATPVTVGDRAAVLRLRERLSAYDVVDGSGRVLEHHARGEEQRFTVTLVRTPAGWRTATVVRG